MTQIQRPANALEYDTVDIFSPRTLYRQRSAAKTGVTPVLPRMFKEDDFRHLCLQMESSYPVSVLKFNMSSLIISYAGNVSASLRRVGPLEAKATSALRFPCKPEKCLAVKAKQWVHKE